VQAAQKAINSPLLEASMDGAHGVLLSIAGGSDLGLFEINEAASLVQEAAHEEANIIFGTVIDDSLGDEVRVTVIAAGFDSTPSVMPPVGRSYRSGDGQPGPAGAGGTSGAGGVAGPGSNLPPLPDRGPEHYLRPDGAPAAPRPYQGDPAATPPVPSAAAAGGPLPHARPLEDDDDEVDVPPFMKI
jgi:cell division protein FtsZ